MTDSINRRHLLRGAAGMVVGTAGLVAGVTMSRNAMADDAFKHLEEDNATAKALGYHHDSKAVDPKKFPTHKPEQFCHNCQLVQGKDGEQWRGCTLFPKKLVNADGWCRSWVKKAGTK
ncbi:MAG: high-potential iron-sulfur protein [Pseudomonadales bacterium]|nr:high-potential iron-sulfur protein [Pseudomonadales bacterium]